MSLFTKCYNLDNIALLLISLKHVYMRPDVWNETRRFDPNWFEISNHFEILFGLHGNLHRDFTATTFQTIARPHFTAANDIF